MALSTLTIDLQANIAKFQTDMNRAARISKKRNEQMRRQASIAGKAIGVAFVAAGAGLAMMIKKQTAAADNMQKLALRTGISTEALSQYKHAADLSGMSFEQWTNGVKRMARALSDADVGLSTQVRSFERLGLSVQDVMAMEPDKQFETIAEAIMGLDSATLRAATAQEIFGRSGTEMLSMMSQGKAGILAMREEADRLGLTIGQEMADNAALFNDNMTRLGSKVEAAQIRLVDGMLPALIQVQELLLDTGTSADKFTAAGESLGNGIKKVVKVFLMFKGVLAAVGTVLVGTVAGIMHGLSAITGNIDAWISGTGQALSLAASGEFAAAGDALAAIPGNAAAAWNEGTQGMIDAFKFIPVNIKQIDQEIQDSFTALDQVPDKITKTGAAVASLDTPLATGSTAADKFATSLQKILDKAFPIQAAGQQLATELAILTEAYDKGTIGLVEYNAAVRATTDAFTEASGAKEFAASLQGVLDGLYPIQAAGAALGDDLAVLTQAYERGSLGLDQYQDAVTRATAAFNNADQVTDGLAGMADEFGRMTAGVINNAESIGGALKDLGKQILTMVAQKLGEQLMGSLMGGGGSGGGGFASMLGGLFGSSGGGSGGGGFASMLGGLFGGGMATGGRVQPGKFYEVNENGPELFNTGSRQFLMAPPEGGEVTPMASGSSGGNTYINNTYLPPEAQPRTAGQTALEIQRIQQQQTTRDT